MTKIAILDDYPGISLDCGDCADWVGLDVTVFRDHVADEAQVIECLQPFDIICPMRDRTRISAQVFDSLLNLKLIATCAMRNAGIDMEAAQARGIRVTGTYGAPPTAELAFGLIMALARSVPQESQNMRAGSWQTTIGRSLKGSTLGLLGLGLLGGQVAGFARAFGIEPLPKDHPIRQLKNAILTPHLGYVTRGVFEDFYQGIVECIRAWLAGEDLQVII
jgi:phosphoglycerate dehydrogenase-like enzyme